MLIAVGVRIYTITKEMQIDNLFSYISENKLSKTFFFNDIKSGNYFWKRFLAGVFVAIVMTGLDQDMMQKNLTCRNLKDAQKNMFWFTIVLVIVNFFFLALGVLLTDYAALNGISAQKDELFPIIATKGSLSITTAIFFLLGLIAAAYSSADSALTSLTTSFSIDILEIDKNKDKSQQEKTRKHIHIVFSLILIVTILVFKYFIADESVIAKIFTFANYTYGPLLGLYVFGLFTRCSIRDQWVPFICIASPIITYLLNYFSLLIFNFNFGYALLIVNGAVTFLGLFFIKNKKICNA